MKTKLDIYLYVDTIRTETYSGQKYWSPVRVSVWRREHSSDF